MARTEVYTGANGRLLLMPDFGSARGEPEANAAAAVQTSYLGEDFVVGRVTGAEIHVETDLEEFHEIGRRHASSLHPGNIHVSGSIERAYVNGALLYFLLGRGAAPTRIDEPYVQPNLALDIALNDPALPDNTAGLVVIGVKFDNWTYRLPEDDFVLENASFKALHIEVRDREDGSDTEPSFE